MLLHWGKLDRQLGILCFSIGEKTICLSLGMAPFISSNYIMKKRPVTGRISLTLSLMAVVPTH